MDPNAVTAWATCATALSAFLAVGVAGWQLRNLNSTLRMNRLSTVLQLEAEINARKRNVDEVVADVRVAELSGEDVIVLVLRDKLDGYVENWLNAVDRLAYCILRNYFTDKDWRTEYRQYLAALVTEHEERFGAATIYKNMVDLHNRWQRT